ncbi:MAG: hypothetical protein ACRC8K_20015 [Waterburya sp.]
MMKTILFLTGILSLTLTCYTAQAQTNPSGLQGNNIPSLNDIPSNQLDEPLTVEQQDFVIDSVNSSQQFFRQDQFFRQNNDQLYFLPESKSEPILKIDETVETEKIDAEDLQQQQSDQ